MTARICPLGTSKVTPSTASSPPKRLLSPELPRLYRLAYFDSLTGIANRQKFTHELESALNALRSDEKLALTHIDLDQFKRINETLGPQIGDAILKMVAKRLKAFTVATKRAHPQLGVDVARLGGDEFVVILSGFKSDKVIDSFVERMRSKLSEPIVHEDYELVITPSIGISMCSDDGANVETLMKSAETAVHEAKISGRNCVRAYSSMMNERAMDELVGGTMVFGRGVDATAEEVGHAAATERQSVVGRALAVDHRIPVVGEGRSTGQPDLAEHRGIERLGGDHQRVERHHRSSFARQVPRVSLGRPHDHVGAYVTAVRPDEAGLDRSGPARWIPGFRIRILGHAAERLGPEALTLVAVR